jgi:type I restriction enzyme S subunit
MYPLRARAGNSSLFVLTVILGTEFLCFANSVSMRTGIPKINREEFSAFQLAVPDPDEQNRMAAIVEAVDQRAEMERSKLEKIRSKKSGLMDDLLTGRVRVTPLLDRAERTPS